MMADVINDTTLSCMARFVMLWILRCPSEVINPDAIAEANRITVKMVKALLAELIAADYLVKPQRVNDPVNKGKFSWTPYTLNPCYGQKDAGQPSHQNPSYGDDDNGEPVRAETPSTENPSMAKTDNGAFVPVEYVRAAGDKESLSLKTKESVLSFENQEKDKDKTDLLPPTNLNQGLGAVASKPDEFEDEPVTEVDIQPPLANPDGYGDAALVFLSRIGPLTTLLSDDVADTVKEFGSYPVTCAIHEAADEVKKAQRGERTPIKTSTWNYAKGILRKQKAEGDLPVESVNGVPAKKPVDDFDPFNHDDDPVDIVPETAPALEPGDEQWQALRLLVESQNREADWRYLSRSRFGGVTGGVLTVIVPNEALKRGCDFELNYRGWLLRFAETIWQGLEAIEFIVREGISEPVLETP